MAAPESPPASTSVREWSGPDVEAEKGGYGVAPVPIFLQLGPPTP